jgi:hypothetical protein
VLKRLPLDGALRRTPGDERDASGLRQRAGLGGRRWSDVRTSRRMNTLFVVVNPTESRWEEGAALCSAAAE